MAIHYAALNNDVDVLSVLHSLGASLNELTLDRHTPLHVAAKQLVSIHFITLAQASAISHFFFFFSDPFTTGTSS